MNEQEYGRMLEWIKFYHAGQTRDGGTVEYWPHCHRAATLLLRALEASGEGTDDQHRVLLLAALGHDLYEDTAVSRERVSAEFGSEVDNLIEAVTNRFGDSQAAHYAQKLKSAGEPALLIKLADLCDNYGSAHMAMPLNGHDWTSGFLWPVLEVQWQVISKINFVDFPKTAEFLKQTIGIVRQLLGEAVREYVA